MRQEPITGQGRTIDQLEDKIRPLVNAERAEKEVAPPSDQKKYYLFNIFNEFDILMHRQARKTKNTGLQYQNFRDFRV